MGRQNTVTFFTIYFLFTLLCCSEIFRNMENFLILATREFYKIEAYKIYFLILF